MLKKEFIRFLIIGSLNTLIGLSIIFILIFFEINEYIANFIGYFVGLISSFFLNRNYTFQNTMAKYRVHIQMIYFICAFLVSYAINICILHFSLIFFVNYIAQLLAAIGYTISSFLLNKFITFKE